MDTTAKKYDIPTPSFKALFEDWIKTRGGVAVCPCVNLSNLTGPAFAPYLAKDGSVNTKPGWQYGDCERVCLSLDEFRFGDVKEFKRFKIAIKRGDGMSWVLTKASQEKLNKWMEKAGPGSVYEFDYSTQEAIVSQVTYSDGNKQEATK